MDQNRQVFELFEKLSKELASSAGKQSFESALPDLEMEFISSA